MPTGELLSAARAPVLGSDPATPPRAIQERARPTRRPSKMTRSWLSSSPRSHSTSSERASHGLRAARANAARCVPSIHRELSPDEAARVLAGYERRNRFLVPLIHRMLSWLVGWDYDGTESARYRLVAELPVIGLRPAADAYPRPRRG
jgi:hypothetical protein